MFSSAGLWKSVTKHRVCSNETFKQLISESFLRVHRLLAEQGAAECVGRGFATFVLCVQDKSALN